MKRTDYAPLAAPPNPRADEARSAMRAYMQPMLQVNAAPVVEAQAVDVDVEPPAPAPPAVRYEDAAYYLTWPSGQSRVCCITGQWDYTASGEIEAWYSVEQLQEALALTTTLPGDVLARGEVVTVTVFDRKGDAQKG